jgi:hypothetical protein
MMVDSSRPMPSRHPRATVAYMFTKTAPQSLGIVKVAEILCGPSEL